MLGMAVVKGRPEDNPYTNSDGKEDAPTYAAPAVGLACRILRRMAGARERATLTDIASAVGTNKTSCLRVLRTLEREGFVHFDETKREFGLGTYLFVLGNRAAERTDLLRSSLPVLRDAARSTRYTCVLVERSHSNELIYIAREEPDESLRVSVAVGQHFPVTAGSHGKAFLAFLPPQESEELVAQLGLRRFTDKSITDPDHYLKDLQRVRDNGYAVSIEEHVAGISGVAVPIFDSVGRVVLSLSAVGTAASLNAETSVEVGRVLVKLASSASHSLGWSSAISE